MAYEIETFLKFNSGINPRVLFFVPTLMSNEIIKFDPIYTKACLVAYNLGVWELASNEKMQALRQIDERYYKTIELAISIAVESGCLILEKEYYPNIIQDLYYYSMGRMLANSAVITNYRPIFNAKETEVSRLLDVVKHYNWQELATTEELVHIHGLIVNHLNEHRNTVTCDRCLYFQSTPPLSTDSLNLN